MVQNLKVDIIYHQTASDFEMEFNLCGCCRMRLLNDKTSDKKGFIKALARDVSRSRIIIVCGPLFDEDGIISTVATAIGSGVTVCNNKTYGINGDETIQIIKGSTPLVTPDGYFGGCIIESGPQTIILLTENRAFRKVIMQNLIHPYIEDISYISAKSAKAEQPVMPEQPQITESDEYITDVDTEYDESIDSQNAYEAAYTQSDEHNIEFVMDEDPTEEPTEKEEPAVTQEDAFYSNMYTQIEDEKEIQSRYEQSFVPSEKDSMFIADDQYEQSVKDNKNKKSRSMDITIVILVLILLLAVLSLVYFVFLKPYTMGVSTGEYLKEIFSASSNNSLL